ncbi:MAG: acyl-CoA synthetase FdrA [Defluviitaleaceae bacterium]|nr:acyl-CoA synthetase FdrA [Defluviitaleaceae bacterium]
MPIFCDVKRNSYFDSVTLMIISNQLKEIGGVTEALAGMATDLNKELAENLGLMTPEVEALEANDFFLAVKTEDEKVFNEATQTLETLLKKKSSSASNDYRPPTLASAVRNLPQANIAVISLPGQYAAAETEKALDEGLHVMLFSDGVSLADEARLKQKAHEKGLLVMGPDCGTAMIGGTALCFANVVRRGKIGIVGASGTGIQELSTLIDKFGGGVSHAIGTGGRDLKVEIGGIMMLDAIDALGKDESTEVLAIISKPPPAEIAAKIFEKLRTVPKKIIVHFLGSDPTQYKDTGFAFGKSLEDAAYKAVMLETGKEPTDFTGFTAPASEIEKAVETEAKKLGETAYIRGLYSGGTLAYEALLMLEAEGMGCYSNIPLKPEFKLKDVFISQENTIIDFGDDDFTVGKPHPMIDPTSRQDAILKEAADPNVGIILFDLVLGYGAHEDIAGEIISAIKKAQVKLSEEKRQVVFIGFACGTEGDIQGLEKSEALLRENGVVVLPSNAQAIRFVQKLLTAKAGGKV